MNSTVQLNNKFEEDKRKSVNKAEQLLHVPGGNVLISAIVSNTEKQHQKNRGIVVASRRDRGRQTFYRRAAKYHKLD